MSLLDTIKGGINFGNVPNAYDMIIKLGSNLDPIMMLIGALAYTLGIVFILNGILHLKKAGMDERAQETPTKALMIMLVGVLLLYLPTTISSFSVTAFGSGSHNPLGYTLDTSVSEKVNNAMRVIYQFIGVAGIAAFVYGCVILKGTTEGKNDCSVGKGMWHLIGGVAAIHLDFLVQVFKSSAGLS